MHLLSDDLRAANRNRDETHANYLLQGPRNYFENGGGWGGGYSGRGTSDSKFGGAENTLSNPSLHHARTLCQSIKPGFHIIVSIVKIVSVTEILVALSGRKDRRSIHFRRKDRLKQSQVCFRMIV